MLKKSPILFALAVFVLAIGWPITPVQAHCKGPHTGNHPHCLDPGSTYDVTMTGDLSFIDPTVCGHGRRGQVKASQRRFSGHKNRHGLFLLNIW